MGWSSQNEGEAKAGQDRPVVSGSRYIAAGI